MDPVAQYLEKHPPAEALVRARTLAGRHYENFAVSSRFVPAELRDDFARLYAFCRATDDLGDEAAGDRTALLRQWEADLARTVVAGDDAGEAAVAWPLAGAAALMRERALPVELFADLIAANRQDQVTVRYEDWNALAGYAKLSANCVGRLVLRLFKAESAENDRLSDAICTGLQYANFWQDLGVDARKGRIYAPAAEWKSAGAAEADFFAPAASPALKSLLRERLLPRTRAMFAEGEALRAKVPAPLGRQLALYLGGGRAILNAIERGGCDPLTRRPVVGKGAKLKLFLLAMIS